MILVAALIRLLLARLIGSQIKVLEQAARQGGKGSLVVDRQGERIELGSGLFLDPRSDEIEAGARRFRRLLARQALTREQTDGGRQRHFFGGPCAGDGVEPDARIGKVIEVGSNAVHRFRAKGFDPGRLKRIEHRPSVAVGDGRPGGVKLGVVVTQADRHRVCSAARLGHQPRLQARTRRHDPRDLARRLAAGIGSEDYVRICIPGDRTRRTGEDRAEALKRGRHRHRVSMQERSALRNGQWRARPNPIPSCSPWCPGSMNCSSLGQNYGKNVD